jgi:hypothetical protein
MAAFVLALRPARAAASARGESGLRNMSMTVKRLC